MTGQEREQSGLEAVLGRLAEAVEMLETTVYRASGLGEPVDEQPASVEPRLSDDVGIVEGLWQALNRRRDQRRLKRRFQESMRQGGQPVEVLDQDLLMRGSRWYEEQRKSEELRREAASRRDDRNADQLRQQLLEWWQQGLVSAEETTDQAVDLAVERLYRVPVGHPHAALITGLRQLAIWMLEHPDVELPVEAGWYHWPILEFTDADGEAKIRALAEALGVPPEVDPIQATAARTFAGLRFAASYEIKNTDAVADTLSPVCGSTCDPDRACWTCTAAEIRVWVERLRPGVGAHQLVRVGEIGSGTVCGLPTRAGTALTIATADQHYQVAWCGRCWTTNQLAEARAVGETTQETTVGSDRATGRSPIDHTQERT